MRLAWHPGNTKNSRQSKGPVFEGSDGTGAGLAPRVFFRYIGALVIQPDSLDGLVNKHRLPVFNPYPYFAPSKLPDKLNQLFFPVAEYP